MSVSILKTFNISRGEILCATPFITGQYVAGGSSTNTVMLFPLRPENRLRRLIGHRGPITCIETAKSYPCLVTGSEDSTVRFWRIHDQDETCESMEPGDGPVSAIAVSDLGDRVAVVGKNSTPSLWDPFDQEAIKVFPKHSESVKCIAINSSSSMIATGSIDGLIRFFDIRTGSMIRSIDATSTPLSISFASDGAKIAIGATSGCLMIGDVELGTISQYGRIHTEEILSVQYHPASQYILTSSSDGSAAIVDSSTLDPIFTITAHKGKVYNAKWSSDGMSFTTCGSDNRLIYWSSPSSGEAPAPLPQSPILPEVVDEKKQEEVPTTRLPRKRVEYTSEKDEYDALVHEASDNIQHLSLHLRKLLEEVPELETKISKLEEASKSRKRK